MRRYSLLLEKLKAFGRFILRLWTAFYLMVGVSLIWGCSSLMPVVVHPMADLVLEGTTPSKKIYGAKVTLNGIYKARLYPAREVLPFILEDADKQDARSKEWSDMLQQILATSGLVSTGALPFAMRSVPKGHSKD